MLVRLGVAASCFAAGASGAGSKPAWYPYDTATWSLTTSGANPVCAAGHMQSPVDLPVCAKKDTSLSAITVAWGSQSIELINNGHAVQTTAKATTGKMTANGATYTLAQCHWHWGSEHTVGGQQMPLCVHCVHTKDGVANRYGVLGTLYNVGASNGFLALIEDHLPTAAASPSSFTGPVDFDLVNSGLPLNEYYTYDGSFTTPPCTEAVDWFVLQNQATLTQAQLNKFKTAIGWSTENGNYRPPQPLNGRVIKGCSEAAWYPYNGAAWSAGASGAHPVCEAGHMQSPIDLPVCTVKDTSRGALALTWSASAAIKLTNNGHAVQATPTAAAGKMTTASGVVYSLAQCHWHWGSEHTVGGQQMPLCVHCVHTKDGVSGRYGVLGVLYTIGAADTFLSSVEDHLTAAPSARRLASTSETTSSFTGPVDFSKITQGLALNEYYTYHGSFTTPPCTEAVDWFVLQNFATMTQAQLDKFKAKIGWAVAGGNYRPPQPLHGRVVTGCTQEAWYPYSGEAWSSAASGSNPICTAGHMQSPVDLPVCATKDTTLPAIAPVWGSQAIELINNGHAVQTTPQATTGKMTVGTEKYTLAQCHWHWGSEHFVGGSQMPLCVHCVHTKDGVTGRYGVLGVLYDVGSTANTFLTAIEDHLPNAPSSRRLASSVKSSFTGPIDFDQIYSGLSLTEYWTYDGSFTTPPCTEAVDWRVLQNFAPMTQAQLDKFKAKIGWTQAGGNFRPPQPLNGRKIQGCASAGDAYPWYPYDTATWANTAKGSNPICAAGHFQSPVDLPVCKVKDTSRPALAVSWGSQAVELINNGHTVQVTAKGTKAGKMIAGDVSYSLVQCHWHWGSEHFVGGQQMPLCVHCVHTRDGADGRYGVLGVLYDTGYTKDAFLSAIEDHLPAPSSGTSGYRRLATVTTSTFVGPVNFDQVYAGLPLNEYYTYPGSFTTPPCTEAVDWFVLQNFATMTPSQLYKFQEKIGSEGGNFRPPQPLNGRTITGCKEAAWYPYSGEAWSMSTSGANPVCTAGHMQSPVDLPVCVKKDTSLPAISLAWGTQAIELINNGHTVQTTAKGTPGTMTVGTEKYTLAQCHWHWGSEHFVGGQQMPLCVHCVHTKDGVTGRYGVLGVLYNVGSTANTFLSAIEDHLPAAPVAPSSYRRLATGPSKSSFLGPVDFDKVYDGLSLTEYYTYDGSFTTPPCTEAVDWRVLQNFATMTVGQLDKFKVKIGTKDGNFRPPQPLHGRVIKGCTESAWYPYNGDAWSSAVSGSHPVCTAGHMQSPVDLPSCPAKDTSLPAIVPAWGTQAIELINNGHAVQTTAKGTPGKMTVGTEKYTLAQCHWHWGSEHFVSGSQMPLCVHCVHTKDGVTGRYGVLGVLYTLTSTENGFLSLIEDHLPASPTAPSSYRRLASGPAKSSFLGPVDFDQVYAGLALNEYWTYDGSFTTPPCTEAVDWRVLQNFAPISKAQLKKFEAAIGWGDAAGNFRPPQPLNGRKIMGCKYDAWYPYKEDAWSKSAQGAHEVCGAGLMQSPIDLPVCATVDTSLPKLTASWGTQKAELVNNGHTVQINAKDMTGKMDVGGVKYTLVQCHWHWGSEHTVSGSQKPLCIHCVHLKDGKAGRYGVLGLLYSEGTMQNAFLSKIMDKLPSAKGESTGYRRLAGSSAVVALDAPVNFDEVYAGVDLAKYWTYDGSFTTPPCTEAVDWHVLQESAAVSKLQLQLLKTAMGWSDAGGNYRPPQPLNGRIVQGCKITLAEELSAKVTGTVTLSLADTALFTQHQKSLELAVAEGLAAQTLVPKENIKATCALQTGSARRLAAGTVVASYTVTVPYNAPATFPSVKAITDNIKAATPTDLTTKIAAALPTVAGLTVTVSAVATPSAATAPWYPYNEDAWSSSASGANPICSAGQMQSPVDLPMCVQRTERQAINVAWGSHSISLINNGHTVQATVTGTGGKMTVGGTTYTLAQCHWHWGSEHFVDGVQKPMVVHCVHTKDGVAGKYGVLGVLYETSTEADAFLATMEDHLPSSTSSRRLGTTTTSSFSGPVAFDQIITGLNMAHYWSYDGSFTTPPCTEAVDWYVLQDYAKMSAGQLSKFQAAMGWSTAGGNFRPPQPLHGRTILGCEKTKPWYPYSETAWAGEVKGADATCAAGHFQSPVDLPACAEPENRAPVNITWGKHEVVLKNTGYTVQLDVIGSAKMVFGAYEYKLAQCHFHVGSEHTIGGRQFELCVHCVHVQTGGPQHSMASQRYGVLGLLYEVSETEADPFLAQFENALPSTSGAKNVSSFAGPIDFSMATGNVSSIPHYYTYEGSLTTPPCTEAVDWYVAMDRRKVSKAQLQKFTSAIGVENFRPPQDLHGRMVFGCKEMDVDGTGRAQLGAVTVLLAAVMLFAQQ